MVLGVLQFLLKQRGFVHLHTGIGGRRGAGRILFGKGGSPREKHDEFLAHRGHLVGVLFGKVCFFSRIGGQIVQLLFGQVDVLPSPLAQRTGRGELQLEQGDQRLGIRGDPEIVGGAVEERDEAVALGVLFRIETEQIDDRRNRVDQPDLCVDRGVGLDFSRKGHEKRDAGRLVVDRPGVSVFIMIAKPLAETGSEHNESLVADAQLGQLVEDAAHLLIHEGQFCCVGIFELAREGFERCVWRGSVSHVYPEKEGIVAIGTQPGDGAVGELFGIERSGGRHGRHLPRPGTRSARPTPARSLGTGLAHASARPARVAHDLVLGVEEIIRPESLVEAEGFINVGSRHARYRRITFVVQDLRQGHVPLAERHRQETAETDAMDIGIDPGDEGRDRRDGDRNRRSALSEERAARCQLVEVRRRVGLKAHTAETVGSDSVKRDEKHRCAVALRSQARNHALLVEKPSRDDGKDDDDDDDPLQIALFLVVFHESFLQTRFYILTNYEESGTWRG